MNEKKTVGEGGAKRLLSISSAVLTVVAVLVGIGYIAAACHIYYTGGSDPYTRERVGEYLVYLSAPSLILIVGVIFTGILALKSPEAKRVSAISSPTYLLERAKKRNPTYTLDKETRDISRKETKRRGICVCITAVITVIMIAAALVLALDRSQYKNEQLTREVVSAFLKVLPMCAVAIAALTACAYLCAKSARRELDAHLTAVREGRFDAEAVATPTLTQRTKGFFKKNEKPLLLTVKIAVFVASAALVIYGALSGGMADVLAKAVKICTECIGLG